MCNTSIQTSLFTIEDKIIRGRKLCYPPIHKHLGEILLDNLKKNPDFVGQIDSETGETSTYKKLAEKSIRCAIWLKKQGIEPGDVVAICTENNIASWAPFCAAFYLGANLNPWYCDWPDETARYFINLTKPKIMFANEKAGRIMDEIIKEEKIDMKIVIFGKVDGLESFEDIIKEQNEDEVEKFVCISANPDDNCLVLFSSGSTGPPKGVQFTYEGAFYIFYRFNAQFTKTEGMAAMNPSPMYWIGAILHIFRCLLTISPAIIIRGWSPEKLCEAIEKYRVTWMCLGTGMVKDLFQSQILVQYDLSSMKTLLFGGSKPRLEVIKKVNRSLKNAAKREAYGLTEIGLTTMQLDDEKEKNNCNSCGVVLADVEMKVVDVNTGEILGQNQEGELHFKTKGMLKCYFKNPRATDDAIDSDGWFHTGDLGYYDGKGYVYYIDRIKELIKFRGHHISPLEIEHVLLKHPAILEAAVVAVPHHLDDEHPIAFVTKAEGAEVSEEELLELTLVLGDPRKLRGGIIFLEKLPKTPNLKIDKKKLKEMAKIYVQSN